MNRPLAPGSAARVPDPHLPRLLAAAAILFTLVAAAAILS